MLGMTAAGLCAAGLPAATLGKAMEPRKIRIALQLYSVRSHCRDGFDETLEAIAAMGFDGVEFAGFHNYENKPEEMKKRLESLKLKIAGSHVMGMDFRPHKLGPRLDYHRKLGCTYMISPGHRDACHPQKHKDFAALMIAAAKRLKAHGMFTGFHNHAGEMKKVEGKTYWEHFADATEEDMVLQQDVGWTVYANEDPVKFINKYPGRTRTIHFKPTVKKGDAGKQPIIGQDSVPWKPIIEACTTVGGTEWFIIEQERYLQGKTPLECSKLSLEGLKAILKETGTVSVDRRQG